MTSFIAQLHNKSYFIDPQVHAFQQPLKMVTRRKDGEVKLKQSIDKLADIYGSIIRTHAGEKPIGTAMLDEEIITEICEKVLEFELDIIPETTTNIDVQEFLDFAEADLTPELLIAPYLYLEPDNLENELDTNKLFIDKSKEILNAGKERLHRKPLFGEVVIDQEVLLDPEKRDDVIETYRGCELDGLLIWIDDFEEQLASKSALSNYKEFIRQFSSQDIPLINLHGSYFSVMLSGEAIALLAGVGHGIEYGEYRPVVPVGGGVPTAKFYFPNFHQRVNYDPDAQNILLETGWANDKARYFNQVCSCKTCRKLLKNQEVIQGFKQYGETSESNKDNVDRRYPTGEAIDKSRRHYLNNKIKEYEFCKVASSDDIIENLNSHYKVATDLKSHSFNHLKKWKELIV